MNGDSRVPLPILLVIALALVASGAFGAIWWMQRAQPVSTAAPAAVVQPPAPRPPAASAPADVAIALGDEAVRRAGIEFAEVTQVSSASVLRIPATVTPNAYKQVVVTPLVAGRVTRVLVELGASVRQGQLLAQLFSPDLAEAQTRYLAMKAELDAHERELERAKKLVEIGAASQQEVERLHAEHAAKIASVQSLRSRLVLLGTPGTAIDALAGKGVDAVTDITAPIGGVVTERQANAGLNVDTSTKLFTVVDLASVWVVGALYERDLSHVPVGAEATVTMSAYPDRALRGRITYIDPQVNVETRTARVRVEVPNPQRELRFGMYADIEVAGASDRTILIVPRTAVQTIGDAQVVYVAAATEHGKFVERQVRLGEPSGDTVEVLAGLHAGERVVSKGSFFVRAERERLGLAHGTGHGTTKPPEGRSDPSSSRTTADATSTQIIVGEQGYEPPKVSVQRGIPTKLVFLRTSASTCGDAVDFPSLNIRRNLPLKQPVEIAFVPLQTGEVQFTCGVNMLRGTVVVE